MKKCITGCKSTTTDKQNNKWKSKCWKESDFRTYTGSSKELTGDIKKLGLKNFEFKIIKQCRSRGTLYYAEVAEQVISGCLWRLLKDGTMSLYYNKQIAAVRFIPPIYDEEDGTKPKQRKAYEYKG